MCRMKFTILANQPITSAHFDVWSDLNVAVWSTSKHKRCTMSRYDQHPIEQW
jgi:hypothetical protein